MIYFLCPDYHAPSGGTRSIYHHVTILNEAGLAAKVVHTQPGFKLIWHGIDAPTISLGEVNKGFDDDVWVFPEGYLNSIDVISMLKGKKIFNLLNWYALPNLIENHKSLMKVGNFEAITTCKYIKEYFEWTYHAPCVILPRTIKREQYYSTVKSEQKINISYMSRKNDYGKMVEKTIKSHRIINDKIEWYPMDNIDEEEYSSILRKSHIYMATGISEGLNVSVLEAMASGALVVGYHGMGGRDYMIGGGPQQNCIFIEGGDILNFAKTVNNLIDDLDRNITAHEKIIENARLMAGRFFQKELEKDTWVQYFRKVLE